MGEWQVATTSQAQLKYSERGSPVREMLSWSELKGKIQNVTIIYWHPFVSKNNVFKKVLTDNICLAHTHK